MKLGFSGSRDGMTRAQLEKLREMVGGLNPDEGHHGDCEGSDEGFHALCVEFHIRTVAHPPESDRLRAYCEADDVRQPKPYIGRNRDIVGEVDLLIACPKQEQQPSARELRGHGTWSTVRYATNRIPIYVILPSGVVKVIVKG